MSDVLNQLNVEPWPVTIVSGTLPSHSHGCNPMSATRSRPRSGLPAASILGYPSGRRQRVYGRLQVAGSDPDLLILVT